MTLQEKLNDWNEVLEITRKIHRAMQTGNYLSLELFEKYLKARMKYEIKYNEKYHPFIRPIK